MKLLLMVLCVAAGLGIAVFAWREVPCLLQDEAVKFAVLREVNQMVRGDSFDPVDPLVYPSNPERTVTLRKLLEAKDAAVRTLLYEA